MPFVVDRRADFSTVKAGEVMRGSPLVRRWYLWRGSG